MQVIKTKQAQWLGDLAVRYSGSIESLFEWAVLNNLSVTGYLETGTELDVPPVLEKRIVNYLQKDDINPATDPYLGIVSEGIEFWKIQKDFVVVG